MSDHLADDIERMNTRWMPLVADLIEGLWLCSQADSQVALRRRVGCELIFTLKLPNISLPHKNRYLCKYALLQYVK